MITLKNPSVYSKSICLFDLILHNNLSPSCVSCPRLLGLAFFSSAISAAFAYISSCPLLLVESGISPLNSSFYCRIRHLIRLHFQILNGQINAVGSRMLDRHINAGQIGWCRSGRL